MIDIQKKRPEAARAVINFIKKQRTLLLTLSAAVIFITTYSLILPAITLDQEEAAQQGGIDLPAAGQRTDDPSAEEQAGDGVLSCEGDGFTVDASFSAKAGLPSDTELAVSEIGEDADEYDGWRDEALAVLQKTDGGQAVTDLKFAHFYDITLASGEEETQPDAPVDITISYDKALKAEDADHVRIVHFGVDKKGKLKPEVLDTKDVTAVVKKDRLREASFSAKSFSVYGVVYAEELEAQVLTDSGKTYKVTVTCDEAAQIPEGAKLVVKEITEKDENYQGYYKEAAEAADAKDPGYVRSFDIEIQADGEKIEPQSEVTVNISLSDAPDAEDADLKVIHFGADGPEVIETETNAEKKGGTELNFVTEAFSVYTVVDAGSTSLAGRSFALVSGIANDPGATTGYSETWGRDYFTIIVNAHAVSNTVNGAGLSSTGVHAWTENGTSYAGGEVPEWTFENAGNGKYYLSVIDKNGNKKYLTRNGPYDWDAHLADSPNQYSQYTVTPNGDGTSLIYYAGNGNDQKYYLYNDGSGEWATRTFKFRNTGVNTSDAAYRFRLCEKSDDYDSYAAKKVSASTITTNTNYIIYRKFIDEQGGETLYALAHDGTFVRVYDGGDTIYWRETEKNIYWNYQMDGSYPVLFTQDPQTHETIYINPNNSTGQTLSDTANGLTLSGKDNGEYSTPIERWDQKAYDYAGLHVTVDNSGIASLSPGLHTEGDSDEFLFAVASQMPGATAETVDTVDSDSLGIKITMFDYGEAKGNYNAGDKLSGMTNVTGSKEYTPHAAQALVKKYLESGVPSSTTKGAMTGLFALDGSEVTAYKENVNHLFLQSYYDENGTFRYRSEDNYAYLPYNADTETITGTDFTVYRQAATPYTSNIWVGHTYYHHGHFMPFNEIDMKNNLSRLMNQYGNDYQNGQVVGEIPIGDGRTYEDIYGVQGIPNFYTGMMMEANFMQPRGGKLENGDDMIFKFTGDDDMWVYIDDVLVLDIGGIHEPLSGTINFATGKVTNPTGSSLSGTKTLYQIFQDTLNDASTPQTVKDKINAITWMDVNGDGTPDTFADYTNHSFKSFYMERGAGASNLDMQFNLKVIRTDEFTVKKEIPGDIDPRFANQKYKFQATFKDGSDEKPLYAGAKKASGDTVCTQVIYKDRKDDQGRPISVDVDEDGYFYLMAGEAAVFKMSDDSIQYNVREVDVNTYNLEKITIDGGGTTEHIEINDQQAAIQDNAAAAGMDKVGARSNVLYTNYPKKQNLEITKHITKNSAPIEAGENPVFEFRVYLESTVGSEQKLIPYSYGPYYLIKEVKGEIHYFTLDGENNAPRDRGTEKVICSKTGRSGSINSIPPEYTIIIPDLTIGTNFYLEERRDNIPEGYEFVEEILTEGTYDSSSLIHTGDPADVINRVIARDENDHQTFDPDTVGRIKNGVDAESHVYNKKPKGSIDISVEKKWKDETGADITADAQKHPDTITFDIYRIKHVHEWDMENPVIDKQPTDTEMGSQHYVCKHAGCEETKPQTLPSLGCDMGEWETVTEATCTEEGSEQRVCKNNASHVETRPINALGHDWSEWKVDLEATCGQAGSKSRACSRCQVTETVDIPALEHEMSEWVVTKEATTAEEGLKERTCTHCGFRETETIPKLASTVTVKYHLRSMYNDNTSFGIGSYSADGTLEVPVGGSIKVSFWRSYYAPVEEYSSELGGQRQAIGKGEQQSDGRIDYSQSIKVSDNTELTLYLQDPDQNDSTGGHRDFMIEAISPDTPAANAKETTLKSSRKAPKAKATSTPAVTGCAGLDEKIAQVGYTDESGDHMFYTWEKYKEGEHIGSSGWSATYDVEPEDENGNEYRYYFVETSPSSGWITTYTGQDNGLTENGKTVITNQESPKNIDVTISKYEQKDLNSASATKLPGATFRVEKYTSSDYRQKDVSWADQTVADTDKTGIFSFSGLSAGYYKIVEVEPPVGFVKASSDPTFEVRQGASGGLTVVFTDTDNVKYTAANGFRIGNTPGTPLPNSGGPGTTWIYLLGTVLLLGCGTLLAARRRVHGE